MNILFLLIPISLVLLLVMLAMFVWAVRHNQFEDLDTPAIDILSDEAPPPGERQPNTAQARTPPAGEAEAPQWNPHAD